MANPTVEKLKTLSLRFADKAAVALTAVLCLLFVFMALNKETIETTPDQLTQLANQAEQNINNHQDEQEILNRLQEDGMVLQDFGAKVALRETSKVNVRDFALVRSFVKAEPGAGLIRDSVEDVLLAPYALVATAGRGGIPFAVRDEAGNLVPPDPEEQKSMAAMYGGMPGMPGMSGTTKKNVRQEQFAERKEALASTKQKAAIAGAAGVNLEEEPAEEEAPPADYKTEVRGQRWVAIVGLLNNKQFRERYAKALKITEESPESHPDYKRIEMERQAFDPVTGAWGDWELVDHSALQELTKDIAFEEDPSFELTPSEVRLPPIVDFLPYLAAGYWSGVHHAQLIPPDKLRELLAEKEDEPTAPPMMGMMSAEMGSSMMDPSMMGMDPSMMMGSAEMGSSMMGEFGMGMGMMARPAAAGPEHMTQEETIMVRGLDYTVQPDTTYRYRLRVVVGNPNYNREDVSHGVDTAARELTGPWSDPTEPVKVPADVSVFAMNPTRGSAYRPETVSFDVAAWDPNSGQLAVSNFPAAPGEFVGRPQQLLVAVEGEAEPQNKTINFQSRELVVDSVGGTQPVQSLALAGAPFEIPAVVALLRPDGTLALHNQAVDATDEQLAFMRESYNLSVSSELNKKQQGNDLGMMYGDMPGMMMGY